VERAARGHSAVVELAEISLGYNSKAAIRPGGKQTAKSNEAFARHGPEPHTGR